MPAVIGAFVAPYLIALAALPLLVKRGTVWSGVAFATSVLIMLAPLLIPQSQSLLRLGAAISATVVVVKLVDLRVDATLGSAPTWAEFAAFVVNPFRVSRTAGRGGVSVQGLARHRSADLRRAGHRPSAPRRRGWSVCMEIRMRDAAARRLSSTAARSSARCCAPATA